MIPHQLDKNFTLNFQTRLDKKSTEISKHLKNLALFFQNIQIKLPILPLDQFAIMEAKLTLCMLIIAAFIIHCTDTSFSLLFSAINLFFLVSLKLCTQQPILRV